MKKSKNFIQQYLKNKKEIGAVLPSSKFLVKKMLKGINFGEAEIIIELGPGTGVITQKIVEKAPKDCKIIVFELNSTFYQELSSKYENDDRIRIINDSAENIYLYLD